MSAAFNSHAFVKRLTAAAMPEAQAEILADELARQFDERLATKDDIARLEAVTKTEIARLEAVTKTDIAILATKDELKASIADAKTEIIKWVAGIVAVQAFGILAVMHYWK